MSRINEDTFKQSQKHCKSSLSSQCSMSEHNLKPINLAQPCKISFSPSNARPRAKPVLPNLPFFNQGLPTSRGPSPPRYRRSDQSRSRLFPAAKVSIPHQLRETCKVLRRRGISTLTPSAQYEKPLIKLIELDLRLHQVSASPASDCFQAIGTRSMSSFERNLGLPSVLRTSGLG